MVRRKVARSNQCHLKAIPSKYPAMGMRKKDFYRIRDLEKHVKYLKWLVKKLQAERDAAWEREK